MWQGSLFLAVHGLFVDIGHIPTNAGCLFLLRMLGMIDGNRKRKKERESKKEKGKKKEDKKVDVDEGRLGEDVSLFIQPIIHMDNFLMTL